MADELFYIYIISGNSNKVLYTGYTSNLINRIKQHKNKLIKGFTARYNLDKLVYYESFNSSSEARMRERQIKAGSRNNKEKLINKLNPERKDLYEQLHDSACSNNKE